MKPQWLYSVEKCEAALDILLSPSRSYQENIALAWKTELMHLRDDSIPDNCLAEFDEFRRKVREYGKHTEGHGLHFDGVSGASLEKITDCFLGFYRKVLSESRCEKSEVLA
ncbi:hypothetical protein [Roseibium sediminis]|uniref:hypothetical protein n=1 Tax=Roseibium sediminis TaxID=1775174 RepID=UPI00123D6F5A|nr:hypothetical protein [Roseibium sediminis]